MGNRFIFVLSMQVDVIINSCLFILFIENCFHLPKTLDVLKKMQNVQYKQSIDM